MLQDICKYTVSKKMGLYFLKDENLICTPVKKIRDHSACDSSCRVIKEGSHRVKSDEKWW